MKNILLKNTAAPFSIGLKYAHQLKKLFDTVFKTPNKHRELLVLQLGIKEIFYYSSKHPQFLNKNSSFTKQMRQYVATHKEPTFSEFINLLKKYLQIDIAVAHYILYQSQRINIGDDVYVIINPEFGQSKFKKIRGRVTQKNPINFTYTVVCHSSDQIFRAYYFYVTKS